MGLFDGALTMAVISLVAAKPHVLMLMIDDVGWADTSINIPGGDIPTPALTSMVKSGVRLGGHYVQPVCSPTRTAFQTGRYPFRIGTQHQQTIVPSSSAHMPRDKVNLPEALQNAGYKSHMIGKWHCGSGSYVDTPFFRGYESFVGYLQGQTDYFNKTIGGGLDFWNNTDVDRGAVGTYSLDQYMAQAKAVITSYNMSYPTASAKSATPLFLFFSHQTVHIPLEARNGIDSRCTGAVAGKRQTYCSMLMEMDDSIQELVQLYQDAQMYDNTLVLGSTDNGGMVRYQINEDGSNVWPASAGSNFPLRGSKTSLFEGGVHATAWLSGGALSPKITRGSSYNGLSHIVDFTATILTAAGIELAADSDGIDLVAVITHEAAPRLSVPINIFSDAKNAPGHNFSAVRFGDMKLIAGDPLSFDIPKGNCDGWYKDGAYPAVEKAPNSSYPKYMLFNITADPTEHYDIASSSPDQVQHGILLLNSYIKDGYEAPQPNILHPAGIPKLNGGAWTPYEDSAKCVLAVHQACPKLRGMEKTCTQCLMSNRDALRAVCGLGFELNAPYCAP